MKIIITYLTGIFLSFLIFSCKKINDIKKVDIDRNLSFFYLEKPLDSERQKIYEILKKQNDETGFVNDLPSNCGIPIWEKILIEEKISNREMGDSLEDIIIPLTISNEDLSALLKLESENGVYVIQCYLTNLLKEYCFSNNPSYKSTG